MNAKTFLQRLKNPGTIVSLVSAILLVLTTLGFTVDNEKVMLLVQTFCGLGIALGVLNNPDTPGLDLPGKVPTPPQDQNLNQ